MNMSCYLPTKNITPIFYALLVGLLFFAGSASTSLAYFNDTETSSSSFTAASFDVLLTKTDITSGLGLGLTNEIEFSTVLLKAANSLAPQYTVASEFQVGDMNFCKAVRLIASHGAYLYNGPLLDFVAPTSTVMGTWELDLELDHVSTNFPNNAICDTDIVFNAWRAGLALADSGYTDEERVNIHLTAEMVVLNEFLPKPDGVAYGFDFGTDSSDMPQGEWVELFNNSDLPFNLAGWSIADSSGSPSNQIYVTASNTVPATTTIPGRGWLVVYMNKAVLNNNGDRVELRDATNTVIDSYTYATADFCTQEPSPNATNTGDGIDGGVCPDVPGNKSYARIPDGIGSWVDPIPTPGAHNLLDILELETTSNTNLSTTSTSSVATTTVPETATGGGETNSTPDIDTGTPTGTTSDSDLENTGTTTTTVETTIDDDVGSTTSITAQDDVETGDGNPVNAIDLVDDTPPTEPNSSLDEPSTMTTSDLGLVVDAETASIPEPETTTPTPNAEPSQTTP